MTRLATPASFVLVLLASSGCPGGGGGGGGGAEAGIVILDSGVVPPPDGGADAGHDAGAGDAGPDDGGQGYDGGAPELGVVCGTDGTVCAPGAPCCVAITGFEPEITTVGFCASPDDAGVAACPVVPPLPPFPFGCDDSALDCGGVAECCFRALVDVESFVIDVKSECREVGMCTGEAEAPICVNGADCASGLLCCAASLDGFVLPVDFGVCRESCVIELPDAGFFDDAGGAGDAG